MQKQLKQVELFMTTFGQKINTTPQLPSKEERALRIKLLREEVDELEEAFNNDDIVGAADALTDITYINNGGYQICGLADIAEELFDEVQRSNMSKLGEDGKPVYREDGKVIKGPNYSKPDLAFIVGTKVVNDYKAEITAQEAAENEG